jgi:hypothetical protein
MTNKKQETKTQPNQHSVIDIPQVQEIQTEKEVAVPLKVRSHFSKAMVQRAHAVGILPHEILFSIAVDPDLVFYDCIAKAGKLIPIERPATLAERMQCARDVMPYYASKKAVEVAHSGSIQVLHALAESALDAVTLDSEGRVIEDDAEWEEIDT